jgi:hypothetical protein
VSASSASSTDQIRNCSIKSGSIAVFDNPRHLRACSRKCLGLRMRLSPKDLLMTHLVRTLAKF